MYKHFSVGHVFLNVDKYNIYNEYIYIYSMCSHVDTDMICIGKKNVCIMWIFTGFGANIQSNSCAIDRSWSMVLAAGKNSTSGKRNS